MLFYFMRRGRRSFSSLWDDEDAFLLLWRRDGRAASFEERQKVGVSFMRESMSELWLISPVCKKKACFSF